MTESSLAMDAALYSEKPLTPNTQFDNSLLVQLGEDQKDEKYIWVLDPMTRKLRVPSNLIVPTHATSTPGTVPSLCIAFLEGRCRHPWCRQAHVMPEAIPQLRHEALFAPTCCRFHKDPHDISKLTDRFTHIRITNNGPNGSSELIPTSHVASTVGLLRYLVHNAPQKSGVPPTSSTTLSSGNEKSDSSNASDNSLNSGEGGDASEEAAESKSKEDKILDLPAKFICRLHLARRCRYLEDCNNIHLCREYELKLQPPPQMLSQLASITTSTRTITIGDICYSVTPLAVGDVSDEDFNAISEAQRIHHRNLNSSITNSGAATRGNSPYTVTGASMSGAKYPSIPDCWQSTPIISPSLGYSPAPGPSAHLRVYDVRNCAASLTNTGKQQPQQPQSAISNNTSYGNSNAGGPASAHHSCGSAAPPPQYATFAKAAAAGGTLPPPPPLPKGSTRNEQQCTYSSADGGVSVSSSSANTPVKDNAGFALPSGKSVLRCASAVQDK